MTESIRRSHTHDHDEDNFAPGPVYQVQIVLPSGVILRSTPMPGEEARELMEEFGDSLQGFNGRGIGSSKIDAKLAKELLLSDAKRLREKAKTIDEDLTPGHGHFNETVMDLREAAERFEAQAATIIIAN